MCVVADIYVIQDNRILDVAVIADKGFLKITESSTVPLTMQPLEIRLLDTFTPTLYFAGRKVVHLGIDIRILTEEIVPDLRLQESMLAAK